MLTHTQLLATLTLFLGMGMGTGVTALLITRVLDSCVIAAVAVINGG